jgi:hypothetical protein
VGVCLKGQFRLDFEGDRRVVGVERSVHQIYRWFPFLSASSCVGLNYPKRYLRRLKPQVVVFGRRFGSASLSDSNFEI